MDKEQPDSGGPIDTVKDNSWPDTGRPLIDPLNTK